MTTTLHPRSRRSPERASWPARSRKVTLGPAVALIGFSLAVLTAWFLDFEPLVSGGPGRAVTSPFSSVAVTFLAAGVLGRPGSPLRRGCYTVPLLIGVAVVAHHAFGWENGMDRLVTEGASLPTNPQPTSPALATAVVIILLALAGLLNEVGRRVAAQVVNGAGLLMALTAALGYLYGVDDLYAFGEGATMSLPSAWMLLVVAALVWLSFRRGILQWILFGTDSGARSQRGLIPAAFVLIPGAAWLYMKALDAGLIGVSFGAAMMTTFTALVIVVVTYRTGRRACLMDLERELLLDELHRVNGELEERVRTKVHQLNRQRTKLALFEERDRIARDLHDRVIQRIFAAGLQSASLSRVTRKRAVAHGEEPMVSESLDLIATELDLAIRELRNSIFELTSIGDLDDIDQVVRDIASRASRILGFGPRVHVSGQVAGLHADLVAQLASVVQEGLSNVARHARASSVEITVHGTDHELEVRVTDDGVGLPEPLPRSSGISNVTNRARQLGGTATWANADPKGTVLTWRVPRSSHVDRVDEPVSGAVTRAATTESPTASPAGDTPAHALALAQGNEMPVADSDILHRAAAAAVS